MKSSLYDLHQSTCDPPYTKWLNPEKDRTDLAAFASQTGEAEVTTCLSVPDPGGQKDSPLQAGGAELQPPGKLQAQHPSEAARELMYHEQELPQQLYRAGAGTRQSSTCSLLPPPGTRLRKPQPWPLGLLPAPQHGS